jgi:hypothetical protein
MPPSDGEPDVQARFHMTVRLFEKQIVADSGKKKPPISHENEG